MYYKHWKLETFYSQLSGSVFGISEFIPIYLSGSQIDIQVENSEKIILSMLLFFVALLVMMS